MLFGAFSYTVPITIIVTRTPEMRFSSLRLLEQPVLVP